MLKLRRWFGDIPMTWPRVLVMAVVTAAYTALVNLIPALHDTSLQDIAVYPECWILFAVFIVVNCRKWWDAALKCFVFFLISQPLIFLIEVPFSGWEVFRYYPHWLFVTLLTLPGAAIAFLVKRRDWLGVAVLSVANGYLAWAAVFYFRMTAARFPRHLLSAVFCLALIAFFVLVLLDKPAHRLTAVLIAAAVLVGAVFATRPDNACEIRLEAGAWTYTVEDDSVAAVEVSDDGTVTVTARREGTTAIVFRNADGETLTYYATVSGGGVFLTSLE